MRERIKAATVLSLSMLTVLCSQAIAPLLGSIREEFPSVSDMGIQMVVLLPPFCIMAVNICMPGLMARFRQKSLLLTGLLLYTVGGVGGIWCTAYWQLITVRMLLGIGCGLVMPFAQLLITELFSGKIAVRLTGLTAAMTYLSGIFTSLLIAVLPSERWRMAFLIYGIGIVIGIAVYLFLPAMEKKNNIPENDGSRKNIRNPEIRGISGKTWLIVLEMCFANMAFYGLTTNLSLFLGETGRDDSVFASCVNACFMLVGFLMGVIYEKIRRRAEKLVLFLGYMLMGIGYLLLWRHTSSVMILAGASVVGGSYSLIYPSIYLYAKAGAQSAEVRGRIISMVIIATFAGQFLSGIWMKTLWSTGIIHTYGEEFLAWVIWCLLLGCFESFRNRKYAIEVKT